MKQLCTGIGTRIPGTTYTMPSSKLGAGGTVTTAIMAIQLERTPAGEKGFVTTNRSTTTTEELAVNLGTVSRELKLS